MKKLFLILSLVISCSLFSQEEDSTDEVFLFNELRYVPVYPGCTGKSKQLKKCFRERVEEFFRRNLDLTRLNEYGFRNGKCKIDAAFIVEKDGTVKEVMVTTRGRKLRADIEKILRSLPKMKPAEEGGEKVPVKYDFKVSIELTK